MADSPPQPSVTATPEAEALLGSLVAEHGPLMIFQSGGCCDGTSPIVLKDGELALSSTDLLLGEVHGVPFYVDGEQHARWGRPRFLLDVGAGQAQGFSLSGPDSHLVTRTPPAAGG